MKWNSEFKNINCHAALTRVNIEIVQNLQIIHSLMAQQKTGAKSWYKIYGIIELSEKSEIGQK